MLPVRAGTKKLSEESKLKLDLYHRRFCEGENRALYGLQHIVYACHASFPLILSPELANFIWQNFNTYTSGNSLQKIEREVVTDFLLSPLVRPVANRQYEVIPEVRSYLLYLLQDGRWFSLFGIETFGNKRLHELAKFLESYLQHAVAKRENNASGFKQLNQWAATAYLDPDNLALQMADSLKQMQSTANGAKENEWGQLRLNIMAERLGRQIDLNIHNKVPNGGRLFLNFQKYSRANAARLINEDRPDLFSFYDEVDKDFIEGNVTDEKIVHLPLKVSVGQRLLRKKNNVQRVIPLAITIDEDGNFLPYTDEMNSILFNMDREAFEVSYPPELTGQIHGYIEIEDAINAAYQYAFDDDIVLLLFSDHRKAYNTDIKKETGRVINHMVFQKWLKERSGNKVCQTVLILDTRAVESECWVNTGDIQITLRHINQTSEFFSPITLLKEILQLSRFKITYRDLQTFLKSAVDYNNRLPFIIALDDQWDNQFLTKNSKQAYDTGYLAAYNNHVQYWQVMDEDFDPVPLNLNTVAFTYEGRPVADVLGEVYIHDGALRFDGPLDALKNGQLYIVKPKKPLLPVYLAGVRLVDHPEELGQYLTELFLKMPFSGFSKWLGFLLDKVFRENDSVTKADQVKEDSLTIYLLHNDVEDKVVYNLSYNKKNKSGGKVFSWKVNSLESIGESLQKFNRYQYVMDLARPSGDGYSMKYTSFSVNYSCKWHTASSKATRGKLTFNENAILIEDGQVRLKQLELRIESKEEVDVFYSVYLLTTDFAITLLTRDKIGPLGMFHQSIRLNQALLNVFSSGGSAHLKVLFSLTPVIVDFSQTGINSTSNATTGK
ncbi:hypothetical protein [Niastella sp. OAS944]|uniref:hypothetical protein n=1 Tax=Niastella sp. OAS944 TaxID=2664089 RepID=UPI003484B129|nr:hypothetical protein [Chitinophagaceae bacterium OAS944]